MGDPALQQTDFVNTRQRKVGFRQSISVSTVTRDITSIGVFVCCGSKENDKVFVVKLLFLDDRTSLQIAVRI